MSTDLRVVDDNQYLTDPKQFEHLWRVAAAFSKCDLVPESVRGKPADCFVLCQLALRLRVDPFMLMQNTYVVHGRPGMEAKMMIALLNGSGRIKGNVAYTFSGKDDDYGCEASAIDAASGAKIAGPRVTWRMVKGEKWDQPKGSQVSKWKTMSELMFMYRAAAMLIRTHYPEVTLGLMTREELEDVAIDVEHTLAEPDESGTSRSEALAERMLGKQEDTEAAAGPEVTRTPDESQEVAETPEPTADQQDAADNQARLLEEYCGLIGACESHENLKQIVDKARADTTLAPENAEMIAKAGRSKWKDLGAKG